MSDSTDAPATVSAAITSDNHGGDVIGEDRVLPPSEMNTSALLTEEMKGLSADAGGSVKSLDQATFLRAVDEGKVETIRAILKNRKVDVNGYNDEGVTALFLAVYRYETHRKVDIIDTLLTHGAKVGKKAAPLPSAHKLSILRHDHGFQSETRKIALDHKTPLLVALELKSALYLKGWEYRHWDAVINLLAVAQSSELESVSDARVHEAVVPAVVQQGWAKLFATGKHELVEVWVDGHYLSVLQALLVNNSKVLKFNIETATLLGTKRVEIKEASFTVVKKMIEFMYTGTVEPEFLEHRGVDLLRAAHVYGMDELKSLCESLIVCTPDNWIKVLQAAIDTGSDVITLKCSHSIHMAMDQRMDHRHVEKPIFSEGIHPDGGPNQLFTFREQGEM